MLISYTIFLIIDIIIGIAIIALFAFLFKKMKKKPVAGGTIGFFVGVILCGVLLFTNGRAYVVTGDGEYSTYVVYGSSEYELKNGQTVEIAVPTQKCLVVNNSIESLMLEKVVYGYMESIGPDERISPMQTLKLDAMSIDYLFDDEPPTSIESSSTGAEVRYWLRTLSDYEMDYGMAIDEETFENLEDLLGE